MGPSGPAISRSRSSRLINRWHLTFKGTLAGRGDSPESVRDGALITRRDAPNAVTMSQEQYDGWMEAMYLLSNSANAKHLMESIEQLRRNETVERQLIDPYAT